MFGFGNSNLNIKNNLQWIILYLEWSFKYSDQQNCMIQDSVIVFCFQIYEFCLLFSCVNFYSFIIVIYNNIKFNEGMSVQIERGCLISVVSDFFMLVYLSGILEFVYEVWDFIVSNNWFWGME